MIPSIQYRFKLTTRLLIHQTGSEESIPHNYVPLWIGMLPTVARPNRQSMTDLWQASQKITTPESSEQRAHYAAPFEIDCEDTVHLQKAPGSNFRVEWPRWYVEGIKAGAITGWDDTRISKEVLILFGIAEESEK